MRSIGFRLLIGALAVVGAGTQAMAAEPPDFLRGSSSYEPPIRSYRWSGVYVGGHAGYGNANMDFSKATQPLIAHMLRGTALESEGNVSRFEVLGKTSTGSAVYGGFIGFNSQWEDVVIGAEVNYNLASISSDAPVFPVGRGTTAGGSFYSYDITGSGSMKITDYGTLRGRAGYVMGNFLPYATIGLAVGRADIARSATISGTQTSLADGSVVPFSFTESDGKQGTFIYGWSLGGGLDVALIGGLFARGEYEFIQFVANHNISASMHNVRGGVGYKF